MKLSVIQIGNSRGIRLPKALIEEYKFNDSVELDLKDSHIEIHAKSEPRANWANELQDLNSDENEELLIPDVFEDEEL